MPGIDTVCYGGHDCNSNGIQHGVRCYKLRLPARVLRRQRRLHRAALQHHSPVRFHHFNRASYGASFSSFQFLLTATRPTSCTSSTSHISGLYLAMSHSSWSEYEATYTEAGLENRRW